MVLSMNKTLEKLWLTWNSVFSATDLNGGAFKDNKLKILENGGNLEATLNGRMNFKLILKFNPTQEKLS